MAASIELRQFVVTPIQTNCYAVISNGECMVVDPGGSGARIADALHDVHVALVVATHGHGDHVGGVKALVDATGAPFAMNVADVTTARRASTAGALGIAYDDDAPEPTRLLSDGDVVTVGDASFRVIACPGHTPGGITLLGEGVAFVGDTLFAGSAGRTDLPGGDYSALLASLGRLAREIPPETQILSGHGPATTMAAELAGNPFLTGMRDSGE